MEKQGKTTREMIAAVYQEAEDWILNGHGGAVLMADRDNGDIWADFFVDQGSRKIYHSSSVITVPVDEIFWKASNDRPLTKAERVDAVYRWYQTHISPDVSPDQAMDGSNRIEIPCAGGVSLVAERNEDNNYNEIFIGLEKDGVWIQDLAVARQAYTYQKQSTSPVHTAGEYEVFVWKNEDSEDYAHEIRILQRKDTEENICSTEGRNVKVIDYIGTKYSGHWNGKRYPSQIEGRDDLHRIYVENAPIHITAGELKKLQSDEAARGKKIASGKNQDFFTWLEAQDIGTKKYAFTEALEAMRAHTKTIEAKKAANILRDLFANHDV